mmetsp:Transcript_798/g.1750  ORF Transcript_798/g.1750 Transcript_798/m.1750 type:complete len:665 (-) Transcript_798:112-2106(-)
MDTAAPTDLPRRKKKKRPSRNGGGGRTSDSASSTAGIPGSRTRRPRRSKRKSTTNNYSTGSTFDLTESSTTLGYVFAFLIIGLYVFGCLTSIQSLPDVNRPSMSAGRRLRLGIGRAARAIGSRFGGGNLNVARDGLVPEVVADVDADGQDQQGQVHVEGAEEVARAAAVEPVVVNPKTTGAAASGTADKPRLRGGDNKRRNKDTASNAGEPPIVPEHKWPASINDEDGTFEDIKHPGDSSSTLTVPKFWSAPIHNNKLMTREQAMSIGSCITPDPKTGNIARGDQCPIAERTIFVAIASYRDWQCRYTVESIFTRAKHPERVRVAVVDQIAVEEGDFQCEVAIKPCKEDPEQALCKYKGQIDVFRMDAIQAVGPVFARHIGHRLYRGEYYAMQSDAHVTFTQDWDMDIIQQQEATGDEMAVQSTYLTDIVGSIDERTGRSLRRTRPIMCNTDYEGGPQGKHLRHLSQPERVPSIKGSPQLEPYWAAGFSFSRGHFVVNVPYDQYQPMIFQGEEMSIGIRGFTIGYDFFATERSICFHHYANGVNKAKRGKVKTFWEHANKYKGTGKKAMQRLLGIVRMNPEVNVKEWDHTEEDRYGLGGVRTPEKFYRTFGIDVIHKKTEHHLCKFVQPGQMHKEFMKHLRWDGMGINYNEITYQFKDPGFDDT